MYALKFLRKITVLICCWNTRFWNIINF